MSDPWQSLERIRARIEHEPDDLFRDNVERRFDRLIMGTDAVGDGPDWLGLEAEARATIERLLGGEPLGAESDRVDERRATDDTALTLAWPVRDVSTVEYKARLGGDYRELSAARWTHSERSVILEYGSRRRGPGRNVLADTARRATWGDIAATVRVTYDRGFDPIPYDLQAIQIDLINRALRKLRAEQTLAAASPDDFAGVSPEFDSLVTDELRQRIMDVPSTTPSVGSV